MNYIQLRQQNQLYNNLPLKDRSYRNASMSVNNEQMLKVVQNEEANGFNARQSSLKNIQYKDNVPIKMSIKRDSFYKNGGTYKTIFKAENA